MTKILIIPGSVREGSVNVRLGNAIAKQLVSMGAEADVISLSAYPMPIMNQNLENESGVPQPAKDLAALMVGYQAIVLVSPEYNSSVPPLLKNALDWLSRDVGEKVYQDRVFALAACSPGALGGIRVLSHLRDILVSVGADMITNQIAVGGGHDAFTDAQQMKSERHQQMLNALCETLISRVAPKS